MSLELKELESSEMNEIKFEVGDNSIFVSYDPQKVIFTEHEKSGKFVWGRIVSWQDIYKMVMK